MRLTTVLRVIMWGGTHTHAKVNTENNPSSPRPFTDPSPPLPFSARTPLLSLGSFPSLLSCLTPSLFPSHFLLPNDTFYLLCFYYFFFFLAKPRSSLSLPPLSFSFSNLPYPSPLFFISSFFTSSQHFGFSYFIPLFLFQRIKQLNERNHDNNNKTEQEGRNTEE